MKEENIEKNEIEEENMENIEEENELNNIIRAQCEYITLG